MSVWGSMDLVGCFDDNCTGCDVCGELGAPYVYTGSHILPDEALSQYGCIDIGYLSSFVPFWRDHPDAPAHTEPDGTEPWMRFSLRAAGDDDTVVLSKPQVERLIRGLQHWVDAVNKTETT